MTVHNAYPCAGATNAIGGGLTPAPAHRAALARSGRGCHGTREDTLRQLVREAYELLNNPESPLDRRDWLRAAAPWVRS